MMWKSREVWLVIFLALAILAGAAFWYLRVSPSVIQEQTETTQRLEEIRENFQQSVRRGEAIVRETERKVVTVRERTVETVRRVSDDAVAELLNAELVLWRMEDGAAGLDNP